MNFGANSLDKPVIEEAFQTLLVLKIVKYLELYIAIAFLLKSLPGLRFGFRDPGLNPTRSHYVVGGSLSGCTETFKRDSMWPLTGSSLSTHFQPQTSVVFEGSARIFNAIARYSKRSATL